MKLKTLLVHCLTVLLFMPCQLICPPARADDASAGATSASSARSLDLSSTERTVSASEAGRFSSATIRVGESMRTVTPGDLLTPAELVALHQVVTAGQQSIQLSGLGAAIGGKFQTNAYVTSAINDLVIPTGVTAVHDFGLGSAINLAGNLSNAGQVLAISSNSAITTASISATNILNQTGAVITSVLSSAQLQSLGGVVANLSLSLTAINDIMNAGTISSARNLTLTAGGSIINALPAGVTGPSPILQAMNNINLFTADLLNSGTIAAALGNINVASQMAQNIAINNVGGLLQALNGVISVRDALFDDRFNLTVTGGDLLSKELNLYSGTGTVTAAVNSISGVTNVYGHEAHISTATGSFSLGTVTLTGDPVFASTGGSLNIAGNLSFLGQDLALLARDDITATGAPTITTSGNVSGSDGGKILIVAGATITGADTGGDTTASPVSSGSYTIAPGSGGSINLSGVNLNSSATGSNNDGGDVTLIAYGSNSHGAVTIGSIMSGGTGNGSNGNVLIVGGTATGTITTGDIDTTGGDMGGTVTVSNTAPTSSSVVLDHSGSASRFTLSPNFSAGTALSTGTINLNGSTIGIAAHDTVLIEGGTITNIAGGGRITTSELITLRSGSGSIGSDTNRLRIDGATLVANTAGGSAYIDESDAVTLNTSALAGGFDLQAGGTITIDDPIGAGTSSTLRLHSTGGSILCNDCTDSQLSAGTIELVAGDGDVGGSATADRMRTSAGTLKVTATESGGALGEAFVIEANDVTLALSSVEGIYSLSTSGHVTISQDITASSTGSGQISITTNSGGNIIDGGGRLVATNIDLTTTGGGSIGTTNAPVLIDAGNTSGLTIASSGGAFLSELDDVRLQPSTVAALTGTLELTISGTGNLTLDGDVTGTAGAAASVVKLVAGNGVIERDSGRLRADSIELTTTASGKDIGTAADPILVNAGSAAGKGLKVSSGGNAYLSESNDVRLLSSAVSSSSGVYELETTSAGSIAIDGSISAGTTSGHITLTTDDGSITWTSGALTAGTVNLSATGSNRSIGTDSAPVQTDTSTLAAIASGNVYILQNSSMSLTVDASSDFGQGRTFSVTNGGSLNVPFNFSKSAGNFLFAAGNDLSLQDLDVSTSSGTAGTINLQAGGNLNVGDLAASSNSGAGGSIELTAGGQANIGGDLTADGGGGGSNKNGGSVSVEANIIATSGSLVISADASQNSSGSGTGGSIALSVTGASSDIVVDVAGTLDFSARGGKDGGDGGFIGVSAGRDIAVNSLTGINVSPGGGNGGGGELKFEAGTAGSGKLYVAGPLAANGAGTGAGGSIELISNSASTFVVGAGAAGTANGVITGIIEAKAGSAGDGGEIIIKNLGSGGVSVDLALPNMVTVQPSGNGKGGTFDFQGASLTVNGSLNVDGAGSGGGGTINLAAFGPGQLSVNGGLSANGGADNGDGGQISVSYSDGSLTVGCTTCSGNYVSGDVTVDTQGDGVAGSITFKNLNTAGNLAVDINTLVSAHNAAASTYGVIAFETMANQSVIVTVTAPGQLRGAADASGASVSFATTSLIAGVIAAATGDLTIQSAGGDLTVSGDTLSAGNIIKIIAAGLVDVNISSASASSIQLSGATVSFIAGTGDLTLDSLSNVTNSLTFHSNQGSVTVPFNLTINGGTIDLLAGTSLTAQQVSASSTTGAGGTVKLKSAAFSAGDITVGSLAIGAGVTADGAIDGSGGLIFIEAGDDGLANSGNVKIYGSVTANGLGLGDGGQIDIKYHVPPPPPAIFQVGGSTEANFVSGSIQVDALGSGQGGQVSITNTGNTELHLNVLTTVSANAATLNDQGTLKFLLGDQPVQLSGNGTLVGVVDVTGSQLVSTIPGLTLRIHDVTVGAAGVNIQNLGGGVVVLNTLTSNGGDIFIDAIGGIQNQGEIKTVAGGDIEFTTPSLLNNGLVDASGTLTIRGDQGIVVTGGGVLRAAGGVNLQSALAAVSVTQGEIVGAITGASMTGFNVTTTDALAAGSVLTIANIAVSGDILNPTVVSSISLNSATSMAVTDGAQLSAQNNISLLASSGLTIGEDSLAPLGVVITAGTLTPPNPMAPPLQPGDLLPAFSIAQPGFVLVDTYQAGAGTGDIVIGDSVNITAHGGTLTPSPVSGADPAKNPGYIGFLSGNDILAADDLTLTSHGGNIWFNALDDIVIGNGLTATSRGKAPDDGDTRHVAGSVIPRYTGGGVAFFAGTIDTTTNKLFDLELVLDKAIGQRSGFNNPRIDGNDGYVLDSNNVLVDKGGLFRVKLPDGITQGADVYTLAGNSFQSIGGVIILDPPADHTVAIQGALLIQTVGPLVVPPGLPPGAAPPAPFISIAPAVPPPPTPPANSLVATDTTRFSTNTVIMLEQQKKVQQLAEEQEERETAASGNINSVVRTWFVSMGYCQPFALEQEDGSTVVAAQGTFLSTSGGKKLVLKEGKIVAVAGSGPVSVETTHGTIVVPSGSSAVVEHKASGALRIANLSGSATRMNLKGHEAGLSMSAGEEVVVADTALSEEELIATDGVEREPVAGAVTIGSVRVNKNKFNRAAMAQRNELLRCDLGAFSVHMKKRMDALRDDMSSRLSFKASFKPDYPGGPSHERLNRRNRLVARAVDASDLSPVSYVRPSTSAASAPFQTLTTRHATFKYLPGHNMSVDGSGVVHLDAGEALVESHGGTVVQHGPFKVHFKPGTVSLLSGEGELLKVRNLWEDGSSSVHVYVGNRLISASAGQELILTANDRLRRHALINDPVGRRRVKSYDLADGKTVTSCEVSFASLTGGSSLLNSFVRSNRQQEQALTSKLIKMAACLNLIHADHGPFSTSQH